MPFERKYVYPLKDPTRFDDAFGSGYGYAALVDRGPIPTECWAHDAWIVNAQGEVHPGLDESPVPIRLDEIVGSAGRPAARDYGRG